MRIADSKHFRVEAGLAPWESAPPPPVLLPKVSDVPESLRRKRNAGKAKAANEGRCRMCQRDAFVRPLSRHHLVPQQYFLRYSEPYRGLRNCDACIVPLCRPCHDSVEGRRNRDNRKMLRKVLMQDEIAFCIAVRGKVWFDRMYPPGPSGKVVSSGYGI